MDNLLAPILDCFQQKGWPVQRHKSLPVLRMDYETDNGRWDCYVQAEDRLGQVVAYAVLREPVPEGRRRDVAEFLTRANFGLVIGAFELDLDDGELRCRAGLDVSQAELTPGLVDPLVMAVLDAMDDHVAAIRIVIEGRATPEAAMEGVRASLSSIDFRF
jgi:hypothetical protein